jgi:quercetin dioxygenase-like cupin family protein
VRTPPAERFSGPIHRFDLAGALRSLRGEEHPSRDGHRQVTIFHRPPVTNVLFSFDAGSRLPEHSAAGLVTIHVIEGRLSVVANDEEHHLETGHILILNPGVPHDVRAAEPAAMLLTVHLDEKR